MKYPIDGRQSDSRRLALDLGPQLLRAAEAVVLVEYGQDRAFLCRVPTPRQAPAPRGARRNAAADRPATRVTTYMDTATVMMVKLTGALGNW